MMNILRQMSYQEFHNEKFDSLEKELTALIDEKKINFTAAEKRADGIIERDKESKAERVTQ